MLQPLSKDDENDAEVTWEDQNNINTFSKIYNKLTDMQDLLAEKNVCYNWYNANKQTQLESITDALQEIELMDEDDAVPYRIGDSFYSLKAGEATERMEGEKTAIEWEIQKMEEDMEGMQKELTKLKRILYGKFGSSINLEK